MTLTNSIKKVGKGISKGLVAIGKKIGSILPGLIGSIVSFFFQSNWETHFLSVRTHVANNSCRGRLFNGRVP